MLLVSTITIMLASIYLLIGNGPAINEVHICYNCCKTQRVQPQQNENLDDQELETKCSEESHPNDRI